MGATPAHDVAQLPARQQLQVTQRQAREQVAPVGRRAARDHGERLEPAQPREGVDEGRLGVGGHGAELRQVQPAQVGEVQRKQIEGVRGISSQPVVRRMPSPGPITFGRGLEIRVNMDEVAFEGTGVFLLGSVLEQFFARYVALNSFTEMVLETSERGEIMRWKPRLGRQQIL